MSIKVLPINIPFSLDKINKKSIFAILNQFQNTMFLSCKIILFLNGFLVRLFFLEGFLVRLMNVL